ncbi:MAG: MFS transporter [Candidatus Lokiarchaeota archaeon]|nr:MFS transporter [Candidatus Lokiarchaeota archaeon]
MDDYFQIKRKKTFNSFFQLYFMIYFFIGIMPVNIDNLLLYLPNTTKFGVGFLIASTLIVGIISILFFGYYTDKIAEKYSRKKIFILTNLLWIISYGLASISFNYYYYLIFLIISAIGSGAFLPIGFSMIGDFFPPKERGKKFGAMNFALILGNGMGIISGGLLGSYVAGPLGWRLPYIFGFIIGIIFLYIYISVGIEPERGRAEPEFDDFKGEINYNYKITFNSLTELFRKKSIGAILVYVLCSGLATSTLGTWGIFYISAKIGGTDSELTATTIYLLAGAGALPGTIIGGKLGDSYLSKGKVRGRALISLIGVILGVLFTLIFYLTPFFTANTIQIIFSWIFFILVGFLGYMFATFSIGNQFAIYSEVCLPEVRSTANAMNGLMINIGGIIGNLLLSSLIENDISWLPVAVSSVLFIWLAGTFLWIIPYFYYPIESKKCGEILLKRKKDLEKK